MTEYELSKYILIKLVKEDIPFALLLRNTFKKYDNGQNYRANVTALVGCELRHHLLFDNLIKRFFDETEFESTVYLRFAIANILFLKRFPAEELIKLAKEDLDPEIVDQLINFVKSTDEIIPNNLDKSSPEFLSLRFNTPAWVIRMWQKQFGKGLVFKTLKVNYRPSVPVLRVNTNHVNIQEFLAKHPDFSAAPVSDMVIYQGRGNAKNVEEFKNYDIFYMKMATKNVLDNLDLDPIKGIAIFTEVPNNIYLDLIARFGLDVPADIVINYPSCFFETKKGINALKAPRIFIYEANQAGLLTCLSHKVHTFICMPKSTTFDLLRSTPDYFLRIKQDQLDEFIENARNTLEECSKFVEVGGELVYMVPTLSRKESNNVIAKFLVDHKDFRLVEEFQHFPFETYDSCLYSARLEKVEETSD